MVEPVALARARSVVAFAKHCGAPLRQFIVTVTPTEGFELLSWFREEADPKFIDIVELDFAIEQAKTHADPFEVLREFRLYGLEIGSRLAVH